MIYSQYPDEMLIELIAHQDVDAFEELYRRHSQVVHNLVVRIVNDRAIADEILQETFWQAWKQSGTYGGFGAATAWLYRMAREKSLDAAALRKHNQRLNGTAGRFGTEERAAVPELPTVGVSLQPSLMEKNVTQQIDRQHLLRALASIPGEQRACLEMAYFEGLKHSQISEQLGVPLGTVKTRVRMGLEKLEHILRAAGYEEEIGT